ncbi:hypothetical protein FYK55_20285 [Roseiconus nitratireducens]|uniref:Leucine Rich repeats (2 copies) n=1 Tax=Roseiconus nitratireducens TaxID=2605748 RepID=A0A5M6D4P8_9BACT|nr:hypothetical protein [Roseiconus nitratireducens]KAA5540729.1 hypothetical protein FYK55_20285 [Roseiconus nitratireducens]
MRFTLLFLIFLSPSLRLGAKNPPLAQQRLAEQLGEKVQRFEMWTDDDGNVTGLFFINHQALTKSAGAKPGIDDDDLLKLTSFPKLSALNLESQPVTDGGLEVLRRFPNMKQMGFHYMGKARATFAADRGTPAVSPAFITVIDGMKELEILEIKHNFRVDEIAVDKLTGPFPKAWRLVIDTPITAEQTMHLIRLCPCVRDLQLHRTSITADQVAEIGELLPKLEVLWFKPRGGNLMPEHLAALSNFQRLRIYSPQHFRNELPFEGGWDALTKLPHLERLEIESHPASTNRTAINQLKAANPNLVVAPTLTRSRNYDGL